MTSSCLPPDISEMLESWDPSLRHRSCGETNFSTSPSSWSKSGHTKTILKTDIFQAPCLDQTWSNRVCFYGTSMRLHQDAGCYPWLSSSCPWSMMDPDSSRTMQPWCTEFIWVHISIVFLRKETDAPHRGARPLTRLDDGRGISPCWVS